MNFKFSCLTILLLVFFNLSICKGSEIYTDSTLNAAILGPRTEKVDLKKYFKILHVSLQKGSDNHGDGSKRLPWQKLTFALEQIKDASLNKNYADVALNCIAKDDTEIVISLEAGTYYLIVDSGKDLPGEYTLSVSSVF